MSQKNTAATILRYSVLKACMKGQEAASGKQKQTAGLRWRVGKAKISKALCNELKNSISMGDQEEFSNIKTLQRRTEDLSSRLVLNP